MVRSSIGCDAASNMPYDPPRVSWYREEGGGVGEGPNLFFFVPFASNLLHGLRRVHAMRNERVTHQHRRASQSGYAMHSDAAFFLGCTSYHRLPFGDNIVRRGRAVGKRHVVNRNAGVLQDLGVVGSLTGPGDVRYMMFAENLQVSVDSGGRSGLGGQQWFMA